MRDWSGQKVVVIGAARQGIALARYLIIHGAQVVITDKRPMQELAAAAQSLESITGYEKIEWVCGGHPFSLLDGASLVCPSGGVSLTLPLVVEAQRRGIPLSNDSQIFLEAAPCPVIGITGSAGKTTTTTLVGRMAEASLNLPDAISNRPVYRRVWVGGNIGSPLISVLDQMSADDLAVMELSSFQLEVMRCSPQIAAILNITPNHLDRHGTMESYRAAKARNLSFQTEQDCVVLGRDDPGAWSLAGQVSGKLFSFGLSPLPAGQSGTFLRGDLIYLRMARRSGKSEKMDGAIPASSLIRKASQGDMLEEQEVMPTEMIALRGEHNLLNVMAACTIAAAAGINIQAMKAGVNGFMGVPHRIEFIRSWGGADWYNNSIATAPERTIAAIRSFHEPLVLLAGGRDKDLPWDEFGRLVRERVDHLILFGEAAEMIYRSLGLSAGDKLDVIRCSGLNEAVLRAAEVIQPGDVVLLSPGGTSFDEFKDFEERGECFARWVRELK